MNYEEKQALLDEARNYGVGVVSSQEHSVLVRNDGHTQGLSWEQFATFVQTRKAERQQTPECPCVRCLIGRGRA